MRLYAATLALALIGGCAAFYPSMQHSDRWERCRGWGTNCVW
jgi:hypothetical protein